MKRNLSLLFLLFVLGLFTGCFRDVLSWSPDGRYLSLIEPKVGRLWIWDSKAGQSKLALDTTGTATAVFLPKRWFAGQEMLIGGETHDNAKCNLAILNVKSRKAMTVAEDIMFGNYDIATKGWVYYIKDQGNDKPDRKRYALWGYNVGRAKPRLIYESNTEMSFPSSDGSGSILVGAGMEKAYNITEINADKGTTRSVATFSGTGAWYPQWIEKGKSVLYLETKDQRDTMTLCRIDLDTKTTEILISNVTPACRIEISKDKKWAAATAGSGRDKDNKETIAVARVNLQGKPVVEFLTPKDGKGLYGTQSPDGDRLAYCVGDAEHYEKIVVKDLKSGAEKVVWQGKKE
jgi:hypothetical protein